MNSLPGPALLPSGVARLTHLGVIRAAGADAATFLQNQLTQDVARLPAGGTRLAAWCNPKGRMLASFWVHRRGEDELLLLISQDLLARTLQRLSMFVLRAKLKLTDASAEFMVHGLIGDATDFGASDPDSIKDGSQKDHKILKLALPASDGLPRALRLAPAGAPAPSGTALSEADWLLAEVRSGIARITQPVAEAFVPQMLNYESVGGVDFKKGCYPGQEVVARSQFRGAIKRRAFVGQVQGQAQTGQEVFDLADLAQPVGLLAQTAPARDGSTAVIASIQLPARASAALCVGTLDGPRLGDLHLPYPLLEDV
ncbi:MAG: folate-binding protein [Burkholderiaceae bacterium]|jgi:folate-binding protein YgfZ|nr:folate-binding protein [Burkholderiaceae bacterium]